MFASFSKYFSMTGWRIGWMLVPDRLRRAVDVLTGNFTICPPVLAQRACLAAFSRRVVRRARRPRARATPTTAGCCSTGCRGSGITELAPADGAFYVYADVGHLTDDTMAFCPRPAGAHRRRGRAGHRLRHRRRHRFIRLSFAGPRRRHRGGARAAVHSPLTAAFLRSRDRRPSRARPPRGTHVRRHRRRSAALAAQLRGQGDDDPRRRPTGSLARAEAVPWQGLAADAMRAQVRAQVGRAATYRRAGTTTPPSPSTGTPTRWTGSRP